MLENIKNILNKDLDGLENKILGNLFLVLIIFFILILILYLTPIILDAKKWEDGKLIDLRFLDLKFTITTLGAILAFWYGYKKYERDKEIEVLNSINLDISTLSNEEIVVDWHVKYILKEKLYIKPYIWKILEDKYLISIAERLMLLGGPKTFDAFTIIDNSHLINSLLNYNESEKYFLKQIKFIYQDIKREIKYLKKSLEISYSQDNDLMLGYFKKIKSNIENENYYKKLTHN